MPLNASVWVYGWTLKQVQGDVSVLGKPIADLKRSHNRPRCLIGVFGFGDWPSNDQDAGTVVARLTRGHGAFLVTHGGTRRTQPRNNVKTRLSSFCERLLPHVRNIRCRPNQPPARAPIVARLGRPMNPKRLRG